jgi:hypothetical protein
LTGGAVQPPLFHSAHNTAASAVSTSSAAPLFNPVQLHESNDTSSSALFHSAHDTAASAVSASSAAPSFNPVQLHESNNTSSSAAPSNPVQISIKRTHERATSSSTISPPHKLWVHPAPALSPDRDNLKVALMIGGGADLHVKQSML